MHIIKTTLAIAAAGCLSFTAVHAAGSGDNSRPSTRHLSAMHRASTGGSRVGKASTNRSSRLSSARTHLSHRSSTGTRRSHDRQHTASIREATRTVNDSIEPGGATVPVELPRLENENESENESENDDQSSILFGRETENDGQSQPSAQNVPP